MAVTISTNCNYNKNINFNGKLKYLKITNSCIDKFGDGITPETFKTTPWYIKKIIKSFTPKRIKELAKINGYIAQVCKSFFDNKFGENNYTIIAIGRSVASIAENLRFLGVDTKIIPMSGLRKGLPDDIKNIEIYENYLKSINLDKTSVDKNSDKKFILFDYMYTGNTLDAAEEFFNKYIFKEKKPNFISFSINSILKNNNLLNKIQDLFAFNRFKQFSPVGELDIKDLGDCVMQANPTSMREYTSKIAQNTRNLFLFNVINNISNFRFSYPEKEMEMIKSRYLSPKAIELRISRELSEMTACINAVNTNKILPKF